MHVAQLMLVELDANGGSEGVAEAMDVVESRLDELVGREWFDWFDSGNDTLAGRWAGKHVENDALRYSDDPVKAEELIAEFTQYRTQHLEEAQQRLVDFDIRTAAYDEERDIMPVWYAHRASQILNGFWSPDSGLYDLTAYTTFTRYFRDRVKTDPTKQFLVIVDFHF